MNRLDVLIAKLDRGLEPEPPAFPHAAISTRPCCLPENRLFWRAGNFSVLANVLCGRPHPEWWVERGRPGLLWRRNQDATSPESAEQ